jgi:mRNA-degrading endonuclease RelE of RelBE toxin-antitoxin system
MDELSVDPFDNRIGKPLKGMGVLRSSRIGDWRIIYSAHRERIEIEIVSIRPRGEVYRRM